MSDSNDNHWHLNKSVPIALIVVLLAYGASIVWTSATQMAAIQSNKTKIENEVVLRINENVWVKGRIMALEQNFHSLSVTLARIEENVKAIREDIKDRQ